jgi:hypothetical protein
MSRKTQGDFAKFLIKHADEMRAVNQTLALIVRSIPMDPATKRLIFALLDGLDASAESIAKSAPNVNEPTIEPEGLKSVLARMLPDAIGGLIEARTRDALDLHKDGRKKS